MPRPRLRVAAVATAALVALFWLGVVSAGAAVEGYSARSDFISSLASRGSPVAWLGVGALLASAGAHVAASMSVFSGWRARGVAWLLLGAGTAVVVIAAFPQSCPQGPAGCGRSYNPPTDWIGVVHVAGVVGYELFAVAAMVTMGLASLRGVPRWPRWMGPVSLLLAVVSVALLGALGGELNGLWQRLWVATSHVWLLVVAWRALAMAPQRPDGER